MEEQLVNFEDAGQEMHDVVLIVEGRKFYCSKITLAKHSKILRSMLFDPYQKRDKNEIELKDISSVDFHNFLLLIHAALEVDGESVHRQCFRARNVSDDNVKGLLVLSNMWLAPAPLKKCRDFLMHQSKMSIKERHELAVKYGFEDVKKFLIGGIDSPFDLSQLIPDSISNIDPSSLPMLLENSLQLNGITPGKEVKKVHWLYSEEARCTTYSSTRGSYIAKHQLLWYVE
ncbi:hypothetical protein CAEBREN_17592 [Caenorhabditis brenneri]|uniref:BTB domain-containing protein n=1 Tax=Caenorhabditis brenneri TaxID=135651 RepID=G0MUZ0_CAEBE|nr:hypothetical protein CAEBREN_17592 [Caenorhabditis brenneri]